MSAARIDVGHVRIVMHGVTASAARSIAADLDVALRARLGELRWAPRSARTAHVDLGVVEIGSGANERAMIDAIAERLTNAIGPRAGRGES